MSNLPSWKTTALGFVVMTVAYQLVAVRLFTGTWGGRPDDPLWVGPTSAAIGMVAGLAWAFLYAGIATPHRREADRRTGCSHVMAVPVESVVTGEILALLCPACDVQLPVVDAPMAEAIEIRP